MGSLLTLLEHPSQVASLLVVAKLVHLLLSMLAPQIDVGRRTMGALGKTYMRPGEGGGVNRRECFAHCYARRRANKAVDLEARVQKPAMQSSACHDPPCPAIAYSPAPSYKYHIPLLLYHAPRCPTHAHPHTPTHTPTHTPR
jgi:hypothetical protein